MGIAFLFPVIGMECELFESYFLFFKEKVG